MVPFLGEFIGRGVLIHMGAGVVAKVVLTKTKGQNSGWIVITFGWAIGVFIAVYMVASSSGAHLNPAVTIALTVIEKFSWTDVPLYITAQLLGAATGALLVWFSYKKHFEETSDAELKLAVFCTGPAIRNTWLNLFSEILGTFILILGILFITAPSAGIGSLDALPVALLVLGIGLSLGGLTGYAINPARDLGPRIMHALLPIPGKRDSDWSYAWIPVAGPVIGALLAAGLKLLL